MTDATADPAPAADPRTLPECRRLLRAAEEMIEVVILACQDRHGPWAGPLGMALGEAEFFLADFVSDLVAAAPELLAGVPYLDAVPPRLTRSERLARAAERMGKVLVRDMPFRAWASLPTDWLDRP